MKAFPTTNWQSTAPLGTGYDEGMNLRDYFAAKAMQVVKCSDYKTTAEYCYLLADEMMEARKNES